MTTLKAGLIQMGLKGNTDMCPSRSATRWWKRPAADRRRGKQGVQVLCFQEVFTQPISVRARTRSGTARSKKFPTARPRN